jgi:hypothetical protein
MSDVPKNDEFDKPEFEYLAPEEGQKWRARDVVDIHWRLIPCSINCPDSVRAVFSCLIGHANPETGQLNPSQRLVGYETGHHRETVNRAIKWLVKHGFLKVDSTAQKDGRTSHYVIDWDYTDFLYYMVAQGCIIWSKYNRTLLSAAQGDSRCCLHEDHADYYTPAEIAEWSGEDGRDYDAELETRINATSGGCDVAVTGGVTQLDHRGCDVAVTGGVTYAVTTETLIEPLIETQMEGRGASSDAPPPESYLVDIKKVEEALQGEQGAKPSLPPEGPVSFDERITALEATERKRRLR